MSTVNNLLDKYRAVCGLRSDSAAADSLRMTRQGVHQWRKGTAWPNEDHIIAMAKAIEEPPEHWFLAVSAERASPAGRKIWMRLLQAAASLAGAYLLTRHGMEAHEASAFVLSPVYIMRS